MKPTTPFILLALLALTWAVLHPVLGHDFLTSWDDDVYVIYNELLPTFDLAGIFTADTGANYHPLTLLSLAIDYQIWELNPFGYHLTNLLLHSLNVVLVFFLVKHLLASCLINDPPLRGARGVGARGGHPSSGDSVDPSRRRGIRGVIIPTLTAAWFAIHPMHVESVAWVSERKDVLYAAFLFGGLLTYLRYRATQNTSLYVATLLLFVASLLSKPNAVVFPALLLLIDYLRGDFSWKKSLGRSAVFWVIAIAFSVLTVYVQANYNALAKVADFSWGERILFACHNLVAYTWKALWPLPQSGFYAYPVEGEPLPLRFWLAPLGAALLVGSALRAHRYGRWVPFGFFFFAAVLGPVIQLIPAGSALLADRYTYVPYVGLFLVGAMGLARLFTRPKWRYLSIGLATLLTLGWSVLAYQRTAVWQNDATFWTDVLEKDPLANNAYHNRGVYHYRQGNLVAAVEDFNKAITLRPDYTEALINRGLALYDAGQVVEAIEDYSLGIEIGPPKADYYNLRGAAFFAIDNVPAALADYNEGLRLDPSITALYVNRAAALGTAGRYPEALEDLNVVLERSPDDAAAWYNRGVVFFQLKKYQNALVNFERAAALAPDNAEYRRMAEGLKVELGKD